MADKVKMQLAVLDGNGSALMGAFSRNARRQGWTSDEIDTVLTECWSGEYDHLLCTLMDNIDDDE